MELHIITMVYNEQLSAQEDFFNYSCTCTRGRNNNNYYNNDNNNIIEDNED